MNLCRKSAAILVTVSRKHFAIFSNQFFGIYFTENAPLFYKGHLPYITLKQGTKTVYICLNQGPTYQVAHRKVNQNHPRHNS